MMSLLVLPGYSLAACSLNLSCALESKRARVIPTSTAEALSLMRFGADRSQASPTETLTFEVLESGRMSKHSRDSRHQQRLNAWSPSSLTYMPRARFASSKSFAASARTIAMTCSTALAPIRKSFTLNTSAER
eukprot:3908603-Rhodomonas_salina.1